MRSVEEQWIKYIFFIGFHPRVNAFDLDKRHTFLWCNHLFIQFVWYLYSFGILDYCMLTRIYYFTIFVFRVLNMPFCISLFNWEIINPTLTNWYPSFRFRSRTLPPQSSFTVRWLMCSSHAASAPVAAVAVRAPAHHACLPQ